MNAPRPNTACVFAGNGYPRRSARAFTMVELLVVIAVIIMLASILIVTVRAATLRAQQASTTTLLTSIEKALVDFKENVGYLPPVLGPRVFPEAFAVGTVTPPSLYRRVLPMNIDAMTASQYRTEIQRWYSITSLAEYLIGYGPASLPAPDGGDGADGLGIRHPGDDGAWNATQNLDATNPSGSLSDRRPISTGKVYGPYLELPEQRLLGSVDGTFNPTTGEPNVFFPGEAGYNPDHPKVIVDYWGTPIRYYRTLYRPGSISQPYRAFQTVAGQRVPIDNPPTLADVFLLRPWEVPPGAGTDGLKDDSTSIAGGDSTTSTALLSAPFALFSAGPDRKFDALIRRDAQSRNEDNIVEVAK